MRFSFSRAYRLLNKSDFENVFQRKKSLGNRFFVAFYRESALGHPRLGVIVSKKVSNRSVERNRLRRYVKESFRVMVHFLPDVDIVVVAKAAAQQKTSKELRLCLEHLWQKLKKP